MSVVEKAELTALKECEKEMERKLYQVRLQIHQKTMDMKAEKPKSEHQRRESDK